MPKASSLNPRSGSPSHALVDMNSCKAFVTSGSVRASKSFVWTNKPHAYAQSGVSVGLHRCSCRLSSAAFGFTSKGESLPCGQSSDAVRDKTLKGS
ncbi:hypothetical protein D3C80_1994070 [compost metagenome]